MLEHMKRQDTKITELCFKGPLKNKEKAVNFLKKLGFYESSGDAVPWREAFPEIMDENLSGVSLCGARHKAELTQQQLSEQTGISRKYISEMEKGKRKIDEKSAKIFAAALNADYKIFCSLS